MVEFLKTTFLHFFGEDEASTPYSNHAHQPARHTISLLNLKSGVPSTNLILRRVLALMGSPLRPLKPLAPRLPLCLPGCLTSHFKLPRSLKIGAVH